MARPNLLLVVSDQHNPHIGGWAGDPVVRTPALDRLAAAGVDFTQAYCAGPLCVPSRMALMTGQYPLDLGIWTNSEILPSTTPTFAHALTAAGYETVLCGRMHFIGFDQNHGFRQRLVGDVSGAMSGTTAGQEMFEGVWSRRGCGQDVGSLLPEAVGPGRATYEIYDEAVTARAIRLLETWDRQPPERPFCLVVGLLLPHNPYVCAPELFDEYMDRLPAAPEASIAPDEHPAVQDLRRYRGTAQITPEMARRARAAYYGLVTTLDRNLERLLQALDATRLAETTQVIYTSDHGDLCGEHGLWWKDSFYEGSVRVPLLWAGPGVARPGRAEKRVVSLCDLAPTLTALAEAPELPGARGQSLAALLQGGPAEAASGRAFAETCAIGQQPARMIRQGPWKLCAYHGFETPQLFNLDDDPGEQHDRGRDPADADVRAALTAALRREWDGAAVRRRLDRLEAERRLLAEGRRAAGPTVAECWPFPHGGNRRA